MEPQKTLARTSRRARARGERTLAPYLFVAFECERPIAGAARYCLRDISEVRIGRGEERIAERSSEPASQVEQLRISVPDARMSQVHARLFQAPEGWKLEDLGSTNGTLVNGEYKEEALLSDGDVVEIGYTFFLFRILASGEDEPAVLDSSSLGPTALGLATLLPSFSRELVALGKIAASQVPVLIQGESGSGKELIARAIHELSRRPGELVAINCGALPDTLVESELFGARRGAFTGAVSDRAGFVRAADRGTLFLDEIGDLPTSSQVALLRVLQEQQVTPIGDTKPISVDLRVVAATHRDLPALVAAEKFRHDLKARLTGFTITVPPLRKRRNDLGLLTATLLKRIAGERAAELSFGCEAVRALFRYDWPLNVRELEQCLASAVALADQGRIELDHLPPAVYGALAGPMAVSNDSSTGSPSSGTGSKAEDPLRAQLVRLLWEHGGNLSAVARAMGKARTQVQRWTRRYQLNLDTFRSK
ncbi:MAG: sigma 54-interacting transcriptional regulator [Deltaproteobacteria bacterium]|nr:sigma 54-interacting transcriptional regulator [Deltaproteobacteria bacterium]